MINAEKDVFVWGRNTDPADLAKLQAARDVLLKTDLQATPIDLLQSRLDALANGYATCRLASIPATCFRARQHLAMDPRHPWTSIYELLAPPPIKMTTEGRFNRIGKARLYVSESPNTALAEIKPKPGNYAVVSMLRFRRPKSLWLAQVGLEKLPTNDVFKAGMGTAFGGNVANTRLKRFLQKKDATRSLDVSRRVAWENCCRRRSISAYKLNR